MRAEGLTLLVQLQLLAKFAHPANLPCGHTHHQCIGRYILVDDRASTDEGIFTNGNAADDGAIGAKRRALFYQRIEVLVLALDQRTRIIDIGEDHAGATEYALFQRDIVVDRNIVLDLTAVADHDFVAHEHILTERNADTDAGARANMDKVPDTGVFTDLRALIDDRAGVLDRKSVV